LPVSAEQLLECASTPPPFETAFALSVPLTPLTITPPEAQLAR
jgi:hypothetical protein